MKLSLFFRNLSVEFGRGRNKVVCLSLHPGTVDTDLSRPYHKNVPKGKLFSVESSVESLLKVVDGAGASDSGRYVDFAGKDISF